MSEEKIHIERNTVQETLVIPLAGRKICTDVFGDFFTDTKAVELMNRLDYDFGDLQKLSKSIVQRFGALEVAVRQKACALEVQNYLKKHPEASVVCLGCGLDQTAEFCDNGTCKMYNVDFPDIIEIRNKLIPAGERVYNVATDINDISWFEKIDRDNGAVFFATGVFYYFTHEQVKHLVNSMADYFHQGMLVFDITGKFASKFAVKAWIKNSGIDGKFNLFYVNDVDKEITPWLNHGKATSKKYMTGYFDLREKSIGRFNRFIARFADRFMKMKIIKIQFN